MMTTQNPNANGVHSTLSGTTTTSTANNSKISSTCANGASARPPHQRSLSQNGAVLSSNSIHSLGGGNMTTAAPSIDANPVSMANSKSAVDATSQQTPSNGTVSSASSAMVPPTRTAPQRTVSSSSAATAPPALQPTNGHSEYKRTAPATQQPPPPKPQPSAALNNGGSGHRSQSSSPQTEKQVVEMAVPPNKQPVPGTSLPPLAPSANHRTQSGGRSTVPPSMSPQKQPSQRSALTPTSPPPSSSSSQLLQPQQHQPQQSSAESGPPPQQPILATDPPMTVSAPAPSTIVGMVGSTPIVRMSQATTTVVKKKKGRFNLLQEVPVVSGSDLVGGGTATTPSAVVPSVPPATAASSGGEEPKSVATATQAAGESTPPGPTTELRQSPTTNNKAIVNTAATVKGHEDPSSTRTASTTPAVGQARNNSPPAPEPPNMTTTTAAPTTTPGAPAVRKKGRFFISRVTDPTIYQTTQVVPITLTAAPTVIATIPTPPGATAAGPPPNPNMEQGTHHTGNTASTDPTKGSPGAAATTTTTAGLMYAPTQAAVMMTNGGRATLVPQQVLYTTTSSAPPSNSPSNGHSSSTVVLNEPHSKEGSGAAAVHHNNKESQAPLTRTGSTTTNGQPKPPPQDTSHPPSEQTRPMEEQATQQPQQYQHRYKSSNGSSKPNLASQKGLGKVFYFLDQMRTEVLDADRTIKALQSEMKSLQTDMRYLKEKNKELEGKARDAERKLHEERGLREVAEKKCKALKAKIRENEEHTASNAANGGQHPLDGTNSNSQRLVSSDLASLDNNPCTSNETATTTTEQLGSSQTLADFSFTEPISSGELDSPPQASSTLANAAPSHSIPPLPPQPLGQTVDGPNQDGPKRRTSGDKSLEPNELSELSGSSSHNSERKHFVKAQPKVDTDTSKSKRTELGTGKSDNSQHPVQPASASRGKPGIESTKMDAGRPEKMNGSSNANTFQSVPSSISPQRDTVHKERAPSFSNGNKVADYRTNSASSKNAFDSQSSLPQHQPHHQQQQQHQHGFAVPTINSNSIGRNTRINPEDSSNSQHTAAKTTAASEFDPLFRSETTQPHNQPYQHQFAEGSLSLQPPSYGNIGNEQMYQQTQLPVLMMDQQAMAYPIVGLANVEGMGIPTQPFMQMPMQEQQHVNPSSTTTATTSYQDFAPGMLLVQQTDLPQNSMMAFQQPIIQFQGNLAHQEQAGTTATTLQPSAWQFSSPPSWQQPQLSQQQQHYWQQQHVPQVPQQPKPPPKSVPLHRQNKSVNDFDPLQQNASSSSVETGNNGPTGNGQAQNGATSGTSTDPFDDIMRRNNEHGKNS